MSGVVEHLDDLSPIFPETMGALCEPNGLLAMGGNLKPQTLIRAYTNGIFPCSNADEPILWWSPDPRAVLFCHELHLPQSLRRELRRNKYHVSMDTAFEHVIAQCANRAETWIRPDLQDSFCALHHQGYAHSVEVWLGEDLVGGLYGINIGCYFSGESMFSLYPNTSKIAVAYLARQLSQWKFSIIDCQQPSAHLKMLGTRLIPRTNFLQQLADDCTRIAPPYPWALDAFDANSW